MIVNLILNLILIGKFLHVGLAIATSVSAWINVIILCTIYFLREIFIKQINYKIIFKVLFSSLLWEFYICYEKYFGFYRL